MTLPPALARLVPLLLLLRACAQLSGAGSGGLPPPPPPGGSGSGGGPPPPGSGGPGGGGTGGSGSGGGRGAKCDACGSSASYSEICCTYDERLCHFNNTVIIISFCTGKSGISGCGGGDAPSALK
eukprot:jgi/Bigna1/67423/fgenesh1_pg.3_\